MPLRKPRKDESQSSWMEYCMGKMRSSEADRPQEQMVAICLSAWREARGGKPPGKMIDPELFKWLRHFNRKQDDDDDEYDAFMEQCLEEGGDEAECQMRWDEMSKAQRAAHSEGKKIKLKGKIENRAYSVLNIKRYDEEQRIIEGVASTPNFDRAGDIVEPMGAKFTLPFPLLWQHKTDMPVGAVEWAEPTEKGIPFRARIAKIEEPGELKNLCDKAWQSVKAKLVKAVSIGYLVRAHEMLREGRMWVKEYEILELSLVTIPANSEATIHAIRSLDETFLQQLPDSPGQTREKRPTVAVGATRKSTVKLQEATMAKKSMAEQISAFEATRSAKEARMEEIMTDSTDRGETLNAEEQTDYDDLAADVKSIDEHLVRLRLLEKRQLAKATEVSGKSIEDASKSRGTVRAEGMRSNVPKGILFTRHFMCKAYSFLRHTSMLEAAQQLNFFEQTPELETIIKAPVAVGTTTGTTWAAPLVEPRFMADEFIGLLNPLTIIGRIPGLRRVPFNVKIPRATSSVSVSWVGEGSPKPVSAAAFDSISLGFTKVAGITVVTEELFAFSNPSIEVILRDMLLQSCTQLTDFDFLDPTKAAVIGVSPASITYGVAAIPASGTTADALRTDLGTLLAAYADLNMSMAGLVLVMKSQRAIRISLMRNTLGQREFEGLGPNGGTLEGIPVIVSENIVDSGSPGADLIVAINAPEVLLADDGQVSIDLSREASLEMDSVPDSPPAAATVMRSLWQTNSVGLRAERQICWLPRRSGAVQYIEGAAYA